MVEYKDNEDHLSIGGVDMSDYLVEVSITRKQGTGDATYGSGVQETSRGEGIKDCSLDLTIVYDIDQESAVLAACAPGTKVVIWGPRGNTGGYPCHEQSFIFEEAGHSYSMDAKGEKRVFTISAEQAAGPVKDLLAGGVFA